LRLRMVMVLPRVAADVAQGDCRVVPDSQVRVLQQRTQVRGNGCVAIRGQHLEQVHLLVRAAAMDLFAQVLEPRGQHAYALQGIIPPK